MAGIISDISEMGCSIEIKTDSAVEVPVGVNVIISCYLLGMAEKQALKGIVRNTTKDRKKVKLGVQYEDLDAKLISAISTYISKVADFIDECDQCVAKRIDEPYSFVIIWIRNMSFDFRESTYKYVFDIMLLSYKLIYFVIKAIKMKPYKCCQNAKGNSGL